MRGNLRETRERRDASRSIPACAGEPSPHRDSAWTKTVYPRVCGGTRDAGPYFTRMRGLSPRVRGNLQHDAASLGLVRSIPACAGEPSAQGRVVGASAVYPRVCGGTAAAAFGDDARRGLSPRVRGNHRMRHQRAHMQWSIPACAGEPVVEYVAPWARGVYPRVCGGTLTLTVLALLDDGLSPRVRGNPMVQSEIHSGKRSIPACAGEPLNPFRRNSPMRVYPRVCGGTPPSRGSLGRVEGLSPRVRGNRRIDSEIRVPVRSIPACAGEPSQGGRNERPEGVYPRVCGGTRPTASARPPISGLSPRVRGNHPVTGQLDHVVGSIPACAGEPRWRSRQP